MEQTLANRIAQTLSARKNCLERGEQGAEWAARHSKILKFLAGEYLPHGSGLDSGTHIDLERGTRDKIILQAGYHCMDGNGFYCGWVDIEIAVTASLMFGGVDVKVKVKGRPDDPDWDKDALLDYLGEVFQDCVERVIGNVEWSEICKTMV